MSNIQKYCDLIGQTAQHFLGGSQLSATELWHQKVAAAKAAGMDPLKATKTVDRENPGLRMQMLSEANARPATAMTMRSSPEPSRPQPPTTSRPGPPASFGVAVKRFEEQGLDRVAAVRRAKTEYPHLLERLHAQAGAGIGGGMQREYSRRNG